MEGELYNMEPGSRQAGLDATPLGGEPGSDSTPSEIGAVAEREVAYALACAGYDVYVPMFMPHSRVDLIAHGGGRVQRIQAKSARRAGDVVYFRCCSNTANVPKAYHGEIDAFGVYCPDLKSVYLIPIDHVPERGCSLRLSPPKNNQQKGIRWARDYLIGGGG